MSGFSWGGAIDEAAEQGEAFAELEPPTTNGTWPAIVRAAKAGESNNKGTPQLALKWEITEGPQKGKGGWGHWYVSQSTVARFIEQMTHLGVPKDWWRQFGGDIMRPLAMVAEGVKGKEANVNWKLEPAKDGYEARMRPAWINKLKKGVGDFSVPAAPAAPAPPAAAPPAPPAAPPPAPPAPPAAEAAPADAPEAPKPPTTPW